MIKKTPKIQQTNLFIALIFDSTLILTNVDLSRSYQVNNPAYKVDGLVGHKPKFVYQN